MGIAVFPDGGGAPVTMTTCFPHYRLMFARRAGLCVSVSVIVSVYLCGLCVHACVCGCGSVCMHVCACVRVPEVTSARSCPPGSSPSEREGACASRPSVPLPLPVFRFLDCKGSPGACTTVLCTRCQPHPNTPLLRLLPNPRRPNTSLRLSETSTSPTSAYQVGGRSHWGSPHPAVPGGSTPGETHPWPQEHDEEARRGPWDPTAPARVGQCGLGELRKQRGGATDT